MRAVTIIIALACSFFWGYSCFATDSIRPQTKPGFTPAEVDTMAEAAHQAWANEVWQQETSRKGRISLRESFLGENWSVTTTEEWLQAYNGQILDPPWEFSVTESIAYNNNTPSNALRSLIYATYKMDYEGLNSLTDDPSIKEKNKLYLQPTDTMLQVSQAVFPGLSNATHCAVLLVGHLEWEGSKYVYYLFRGSHPESPRENQYIFGSHAFRKDAAKSVYWQTPDLSLSRITAFLNIAALSGSTGAKLFGTYQEMYEFYKGSDVPKHFYVFGE